MNAIYYYGFIVSFLFGIILFQKTDISFSSLTFFLLLSILILVLYFKNQNIDKKVLVFLLITSIGLSLGFLRINIYTNSQTPILTKYASEKIELDGIIKSEPDKRENSTIYTVSLDNLGENPKENIRIIMGRYPEFKYGDKVSVFGTIKIPENFENENGIEFDYIDFLEKDNIYSQMYYPSVSVIKENQASKIKKSLFSLKESFMNKLKENIPSPYAEFAGGLLFGVKQSLGKSLLNDFRIVGLIHIVVLSGYNISIIAEAIRKGLGFLNKNISIGISVLLIILFVLILTLFLIHKWFSYWLPLLPQFPNLPFLEDLIFA
jgi:competence protein ComEC